MESALPYHEPSIITLIILSGFLLLLVVVNFCLDKLFYCGLVGQIIVGMAWGAPGSDWLSDDFQNAVVQLGYLGLILVVYEGGLSTSFPSLKANFALSSAVALTGTSVPIALSFILRPMLGITNLQAFAAGAALCSTSLGTTFTILRSSGLSSTRLGVVLTSAAMMDDVLGLIMVQVISNLGDSSITAATVLRPILVSVAFAVVVPLSCKFGVRPLTVKLNTMREASPGSKFNEMLKQKHTAFVLETLLLAALVIGGTFAGTSSLLAAYMAGAAVSWWHSEVPHVNTPATESSATVVPIGELEMEVYDHYYKPVVESILKPFFFASIGFSIPVRDLFSGHTIWRGLVYSVLMATGKLVCGTWLVPFGVPLRASIATIKRLASTSPKFPKKLSPGVQCSEANSTAVERPNAPETLRMRDTTETQPIAGPAAQHTGTVESPISLYPACILGLGMLARGEIGFLIAALAESKGIFAQDGIGGQSELFLVINWAIFLCTMVGPLCVGVLVNRVKRLEIRSQGQSRDGNRNVLGSWGVL